jgi:glycosyltransferase involved in cell wall biosynthesis
MKVKKISIVTPCRNAEKYIGETIESILTQTAVLSGRVALEYIICDGNSSDGTVAIAESFGHPSIKIISEPDSGMYDALGKGLKLTTGDVVAYLNAGDYYNKFAFDIVMDIFEQKDVQWLTGCIVTYNHKSYPVNFFTPFKYRRNFFDCGIYGGDVLPNVEQESTFWAASLHRLIDFDQLAKFRYAGDYYLWRQFSKSAELKIVSAHLGGFKYHPGQLSEGLTAYKAELKSMVTRPTLLDRAVAFADRIIWACAYTEVKKKFNSSSLFMYDHSKQEWY